MWQSAELWCLPASTISRWYFAARVGSRRRAWSALMNRASRSRASPRLVGPPCRPETPEASRDGTRPLKERAAARERNRLASPSRPRMTAPVTAPTPGAEVMMPSGSRSRTSTAMRSSSSLISSVSASAKPGLDRRCPRRGRGTQVVVPQLEGGACGGQELRRRGLRRTRRGSAGRGTGPAGRGRGGAPCAGRHTPRRGTAAGSCCPGGHRTRRARPGPRISSSASRRARLVVRRLTRVECSLVARRSGSPGPSPRSGCSPSGCSSGSRASSTESSRSLLVCLA